ncbi:MAG: transcription antitermination protein NusB [Actinomycetota bacterium]|nr:transcription antitermination protein NusB [Actinomycetota bacterium]
MAARSKARKRALDVLYEADIRGVDPVEVLTLHEAEATSPMNAYVREVVTGVTDHRGRIDDLISTYAEGWTLDRMPVVDRNILRLGCWEVMWGDVPDPVALSEAVALATSLSTDDSPGYINGVLGRLAKVKPRLNLG